MAILGSGGDVSIKVDSGYDSRGVDASKKGLKELGDNTSRTTARMRTQYGKVTKSIFSIRGALVALGAFRLGTAIFTAAADIEEGFIGVAKTTGLAGKQMKVFEKDIGSLATTLKGVKIEELLNIAKIAGQLGIKGSENILTFTETVAKMSIATNLTADQAATSFAQLSNILNEPISNVERMGSVINELSNNSNALSSDIVELARRMGGAAETIGLTTPEVIALSATLRDVGISLEVGGSSFTQIFTKMLTETNKFAKASGLTMEQYAEVLHKSPVAALEVLLKRLSELDKFKRAEAIKSLGLAGTRTAPTLLLLSAGLDKLKVQLARANVEWGKGTSLQIEYETASRGTREQLERLRNELKLNAKVIGEELLPAVVTVVGWTSTAVTDFVNLGKAIGETAAKISLFTQTGGIFGTALRTDLERLGEMRLRLIALTDAVKQNQADINAFNLAGNIDEARRYTLATENLKKEIFRLTIGIGLEERAYIRAHSEIQKNTKATKENSAAKKGNIDKNLQTLEQLRATSAVLENLTRKIQIQKGAKEDLLALTTLAFERQGATADQLVKFIELKRQLIEIDQSAREQKARIAAFMLEKTLIEAEMDLVKQRGKLKGQDMEADIQRQKMQEDLLALDVLSFQQQGATADQLVRLIELKRQTIEVDKAAIEQKKAQEALFAQAEAARQLRDLQAAQQPLAQGDLGEIAQLQATYDQKLAMLDEHNALVIQAMINSGATLSAIQATFAAQERNRDKQTAQLKIQYAAGSFGAAANFMQNLTVIAGTEGGAMFEIMKGLAIAQAVIDTYQAANSSYAALAGIPIVGPALGAAAAAAAVVAGLARVAQIQRTQPGSTSGNSVSAGGATNPGFTGGSNTAGPPPIPVTQTAPPPPSIQIQIINPMGTEDFDKIAEENIIPALTRAGLRNVTI